MFLLRCKLYSIIKAVWNQIWFVLHVANGIQEILLEIIELQILLLANEILINDTCS